MSVHRAFHGSHLTWPYERNSQRFRVRVVEWTRHLIEMGELIAKAGLVELADDDRAVIFGALVEAAARLRGDEGDALLVLWHRRGRRAFAAPSD